MSDVSLVWGRTCISGPDHILDHTFLYFVDDPGYHEQDHRPQTTSDMDESQTSKSLESSSEHEKDKGVNRSLLPGSLVTRP